MREKLFRFFTVFLVKWQVGGTTHHTVRTACSCCDCERLVWKGKGKWRRGFLFRSVYNVAKLRCLALKDGLHYAVWSLYLCSGPVECNGNDCCFVFYHKLLFFCRLADLLNVWVLAPVPVVSFIFRMFFQTVALIMPKIVLPLMSDSKWNVFLPSTAYWPSCWLILSNK